MDYGSVAIEIADAADIPHLAGVQLRSALAGFAHIFPRSIPKPNRRGLEAEWAELIASSDRSVIVANAETESVGVVAYGPDRDGGFGTDCILLRLYVVPEHSGQGLGSHLHDLAVAELRKSGFTRARLWVLERNLVARRMYERRGWRLQHWSRSDWPGSGILELGYSLDLDYSSAI